MFSDFKEHVVGVPQIFPTFGAGTGNFIVRGPGGDEDFGREERTGDSADRYKFRTAPLRNLAVSAGFFHNGAFTTLEDAIRFHLDAIGRARATTTRPTPACPADLQQVGPMMPTTLVAPRCRRRSR